MYNGMNVTSDKLEYLIRVYTTLNGPDVPKAYDSVRIPILKGKDIGVIVDENPDIIEIPIPTVETDKIKIPEVTKTLYIDENDFSGMDAMQARQKRRELARKHK